MFRSLLPDEIRVSETRESSDPEALHPEEAACVARAVRKRRLEFATGRLCARRALAELGVHDFVLLPDEQRVPRWPEGIVGSITHSSGYCAAAVARGERWIGLGLDVESAEPLARELVPRICRPAERGRLATLPGREGLDWPKLHFSAKEAAFKSYYPLARHMLGFQDMELEIDAEAGSFLARLVREDAPAARGRRSFPGRFALGEDLVFSVALLD